MVNAGVVRILLLRTLTRIIAVHTYITIHIYYYYYIIRSTDDGWAKRNYRNAAGDVECSQWFVALGRTFRVRLIIIFYLARITRVSRDFIMIFYAPRHTHHVYTTRIQSYTFIIYCMRLHYHNVEIILCHAYTYIIIIIIISISYSYTCTHCTHIHNIICIPVRN
jgi:hypothetical protein